MLNKLNSLIEEFNNRVTLSSEEKLHLKIIENPFSIDLEEAPSHLQNLQASSVYKSIHKESSLQDFYKCLNKKFKNLHTLAKKRSAYLGVLIYVNKCSQ